MSSVTTSSVAVSSVPEQIDLPELHHLRFEPTSLAEIQVRDEKNGDSTPWLWPERIPSGAVTLFCGDPEIGKSFATLDIAARVSSGAAWPEEEGTKGGWEERRKEEEGVKGKEEREGNTENTEIQTVSRDSVQSTNQTLRSEEERALTDALRSEIDSSIAGSVLLLSAEDNAKQTILPRLQRMNADLSKIHMLRSIRCGNGESTFSLARDIQELEYAAMTLGDCKLIVIDPITSYLQGTAWTNAVMIRTVLDPLKALAERTGAAVILVNHLTKTKSAAMYRSLGSISIVGMCRVAWMFMRDTTDPERRLMLPLKNNLVAKRSNLSYKITDCGIEWEADPFEMARQVVLDLDFRERKERALDKAVSWLSVRLFGREELSTTIEREAREVGITYITLRRAREKLKVLTRPIGKQGDWLWRL